MAAAAATPGDRQARASHANLPRPPSRLSWRGRLERGAPMSAFKDLLVTIDASRDGRQRLAVAVALAERGGAHLTGCYRAIALEPTAASDLAETGRPGLPGVSHEGTLAETMEQRFHDDLARFNLSGTWLATGERPLDD